MCIFAQMCSNFCVQNPCRCNSASTNTCNTCLKMFERWTQHINENAWIHKQICEIRYVTTKNTQMLMAGFLHEDFAAWSCIQCKFNSFYNTLHTLRILFELRTKRLCYNFWLHLGALPFVFWWEKIFSSCKLFLILIYFQTILFLTILCALCFIHYVLTWECCIHQFCMPKKTNIVRYPFKRKKKQNKN